MYLRSWSMALLPLVFEIPTAGTTDAQLNRYFNALMRYIMLKVNVTIVRCHKCDNRLHLGWLSCPACENMASLAYFSEVIRSQWWEFLTKHCKLRWWKKWCSNNPSPVETMSTDSLFPTEQWFNNHLELTSMINPPQEVNRCICEINAYEKNTI